MKDSLYKLKQLDITRIKSIEIRTIGLLDAFGKLVVDVEYAGNEEKVSIEFISPVPTNEIVNWLETNSLLDKAVMYRF